MASPLRRSQGLQVERISDFQYANHQSIFLPASTCLIGTNGNLEDASSFEASDLTFSFANGTGDNGLDAGAESDNQWYALYAVPKSGTKNFILKASTQSPVASGGIGPIGFPKHRYLGIFRNGGNGYDATNNSYGAGDIARFSKLGKRIIFQTFNSTNGGIYPAAGGTQGFQIFVANTSTNGIVFDWTNTNNFGFSGTGLGGGPKLPYKFAPYLFECQVNSTAGGYMRATDTVPNDRLYFGFNTLVTLSKTQEFWYQFSPLGLVGWFRFEINGNPNISRWIGVRAMIDPFIVGGN